MSKIDTPTYGQAGGSALCLPPFITAGSIAKKLGWVPSLQRHFREYVQSHPVQGWTMPDGGDIYAAIFELLCLPGGLASFENSVAGFDSKGRGLLRAIFDAAMRQLPPSKDKRPRTTFALMKALVSLEEWEAAAWIAWSRLEILNQDSEPDDFAKVYELVDCHDELTLRLGNYFEDGGWSRELNHEAEEAARDIPAAKGVERAALEQRWRNEINDLTQRLAEAAISEDLVQEITASGQRLSEICLQWTERYAVSQESQRKLVLLALGDALKAIEPPLTIAGRSAVDFIDALAEHLCTGSAERIAAVRLSAIELEKLISNAAAAALAENDAKALQAREDSDAADAAYAAARGQRRNAVQLLTSYAHTSLPRLLDRELPVGGEKEPTAAAEVIIMPGDKSNEAHDKALPSNTDGLDSTLKNGAGEKVAALGVDLETETPEKKSEAKRRLDSEAEGPKPYPAIPEPILRETTPKPDARAPEILDSQNTPIAHAVAAALVAKRYGLAYHLAEAATARGLGVDIAPAVVLEALAVGAAVGGARLIPAAGRYKMLQEQVLLALDASSMPSIRLTVFAGALRPALFAPDSSGVEILSRTNLGDYGTGLHRLCQFVTAEIRGRGLNLTPADFEPATADGDRRAAEETARKTLLDFAETAPSRKLKFHRAITIWTDVFRQGPVAEAIAAIKKKDKRASVLARTAEQWIYDDAPEQRVDVLDFAHRTRKDRPLEAGVRLRLADWLRQTAQHLRNWVEAHEAREDTQGEHGLEKLHELRRHLNSAQADLEGVAVSHPHLQAPMQAAVDVVAGLLARSDAVAESPLTLEMVLNDDLLLFDPPILRFGPTAGSVEEAGVIVRQGLMIAAAPANFETAFHHAIEAGRFGAARQILERLVMTGTEPASLERTLKDAANSWYAKTITRADKLRGKIDDLLGADQLAAIDVGISTRLDGLLAVLRAETAAEDTQLDFSELDAQLKEIEADVRNGFEILLIPLRQRIDELKKRDGNTNTAELEEMAENHDLATLAEHIDAAFNEVDWTSKRASALLERFASHCLTDEYEAISANDRSITELIRAAENRQRNPAADFSVLDTGEAERACELLKAWRDLRNPQMRREIALAKLMQALGFASAEVKNNGALGKAQGAPRRITLHTDKIADREICRVPAFGSEANGRYEIILAEHSAIKTGEELTGWLDQLPAATTTPTFIVVAGHLPLKSRNLFVSAVRRRGGSASCGLIDEAMVVFLAAQPDRRRGHLFDLALPMGLVQPYADTAARTSQEMFYGRKGELDDLWDRNGSCLVYGGRQLGKTALLKQIQLRYNHPPAQLVIYGDLQAELPSANGHNIWAWLGRKLKGEAGFLNREIRNQSDVEAAIRTWLSNDKQRRLLVLVDEADEFLRQELANQYSSLAKIRDLMQATERYCKFVFAGLHDVQRLARTPNSPLLHFGTPVRVGPLMGSDLPEARAMAEGPMATAGFVFKSPSLTGRMLSQVGYYPSLLQAFGKGLIERMNKSVGRRLGPAGSSLLPLIVTERDLEDAFQDRDFRDNIQRKFENTLNLDERYRLITFVMLVDSLARRDQGVLPIGLKDAEVQRLALQWWPQGFAEDQSLDAFQGLLQEMIGLGVLIEQADGRFVIRSARIADMLGGREQIERKLMELSDKEAPSRFDTGALRRLCGAAPSPLTARQETILLSEAKPASAVHLVVSSQALGMDHIAASLSDIAETLVRIDRRDYHNLHQLEQAVEAAATNLSQTDRGLLVLYGPWLGPEMMTLTARNVRVRQAQKDGRYGMRILVVPYDVDWRELNTALDDDDIISLSPLGENSLKQFIKSYWGGSIGMDEDQLKEAHRLTGGFPHFLRQAKGRSAAELVESLRLRAEELYKSPDLFNLLGLNDDALINTVTVIHELGYQGETSDELMRGEGVDDPQAALRQLERLGIVERYVNQKNYEPERRLNPLVDAALTRRQG